VKDTDTTLAGKEDCPQDRPLLRCPRCGNPDIYTMAELKDLVAKRKVAFSADLADWLTPPQRPSYRVSPRHRLAVRNGISFGAVTVVVAAVGNFALNHDIPGPLFAAITFVLALVVGFRAWNSEQKVATREDAIRMDSHMARYRAYLDRTEVWTRLRYCAKCAVVMDLVTEESASLYDVHELTNSRLHDGHPSQHP